ncbi:MAG TPA: hypothetical protein VLX89_09425 [Actinomycetota bacterium]|nr:hypothetical protein [Actinomycetota bacterium]
MARGRSRKENGSFWRTIVLGLLAWAVITELRKPEQERTWHGTLAGFVPYELRPPTLDRIRETYWSPDDEHVLKPPVWGVGWALNVGRVVELIRRQGGGEPAPVAA